MRVNTNRWLGHRGIYQPKYQNSNPPELIEAAQNLGRILGSTGYYEWSSTLSNTVLLTPKKYLEAIEAKTREMKKCNCGKCTYRRKLQGIIESEKLRLELNLVTIPHAVEFTKSEIARYERARDRSICSVYGKE